MDPGPARRLTGSELTGPDQIRTHPFLRGAAVRRLVELGEAGPLSRGQVVLAAQDVGVSERTMWRWVGLATGRAEPVLRPRLTMDLLGQLLLR